MILTVDIGNTLLKLRYFNALNNIVASFNFSHNEILSLNLNSLPLPQKAIFSNVTDKFDFIIDFFAENNVKVVKLSHDLKLPIKICYQTPKTLGQDRIAAVCGATYLYPDKNILVIDAGTAITYDFVDKNSNYLGGNISPGIDLRFKSLNNYTSLLPLLDKTHEFLDIGNNTDSAVASGVINGVLYELEHYIQFWHNKSKDNIVILSGGDASFLVNSIKNSIFADLNLIHIGLKRILDLNVE